MAEQIIYTTNIGEVPVYTPGGHSDTYNRRLIGSFMGSEHMEVILGEMEPNGGAEMHSHSDFEQASFILEGKLMIRTPDMEVEVNPGDTLFIPKNVSHAINCLEKSKFILIYSPPREK